MAERIDESSLPMDSPWCLVILDAIAAAIRAFCDGTGDETVGIVAEDLNARRGHPEFRRSFPSVVRRLADKEWRARDLQPGHGPEIPQLHGTKSALVPRNGSRRIGNGDHDGEDNRLVHRTLLGKIDERTARTTEIKPGTYGVKDAAGFC